MAAYEGAAYDKNQYAQARSGSAGGASWSTLAGVGGGLLTFFFAYDKHHYADEGARYKLVPV